MPRSQPQSYEARLFEMSYFTSDYLFQEKNWRAERDCYGGGSKVVPREAGA